MSKNVLCLHGCNQTEEMFRALMKDYVKIGEKQYNLKFYFIEAKYDHPLGGKTWYKRPLNVSDIGSVGCDEDLTADVLNDLCDEIEKKGITTLLGFSQGANVVDTFLAYKGHPGVNAAVLMSGYSLIDCNRKTLDVPMLAVVSEKDEIVPHKYTPTAYKTIETIKHDKGHKLPTQKPIIRRVCAFMGGRKPPP
jgi:predicted esterase